MFMHRYYQNEGAAPIERAILNGDKETGVSIMKIKNELDTGPYVMQTRIKIDTETNEGELKEKLSILGQDLNTVQVI